MTKQPKRIWIDADHGKHPGDWSFSTEEHISAKDHRKMGRLPYVPESPSCEREPVPEIAARTRLLEKALKVALGYLAPQQPGDSRAVDDWFVACAAVQAELDDTDGRIERCLDDAALLTQEWR